MRRVLLIQLRDEDKRALRKGLVEVIVVAWMAYAQRYTCTPSGPWVLPGGTLYLWLRHYRWGGALKHSIGKEEGYVSFSGTVSQQM